MGTKASLLHIMERRKKFGRTLRFCVLPRMQLQWEDVQDGVVPAGAVVGTIVDGKKEFIGRGIVYDEICVGRIVRDDKCMYASYAGKEKVLKKYQALVIMNAKPLYRWVPVDNWVLPGNAISVTKDIFIGHLSLKRSDW